MALSIVLEVARRIPSSTGGKSWELVDGKDEKEERNGSDRELLKREGREETRKPRRVVGEG